MTLYQEISEKAKKKLYLTNAEIEDLYKEENVNVTYHYKKILQDIKKMLCDDKLDNLCKNVGKISLYDSVKDIDKTEYEEYEAIVDKIKKVVKEKETFVETHKGDEIKGYMWCFNLSPTMIEKDMEYRDKLDTYNYLIESLKEEFNKVLEPIMYRLETSKDNYFIFGKDGMKHVKPSDELIKKVSAGCLDIPYFYANKYRKYLDYDFTFDDLFQTACEGLLYACSYYVPDGPAKFRTYASKCVENNINRYMFKVIKKKYKDDFFQDQLDKTILACRILQYLGYRNDTFISPEKLNAYIRDYNRTRTKIAGTTMPLFRGKCDYDTTKKFFDNLINSLEMDKLLTDADLEASYIMTLNEKKTKEVTFYCWDIDHSKPYNNSFELQKNKLMIYGTKLIAIREMIEYERQYKKDNNGNIPTYEEQYTHIKEYFKSMFKGKRKIPGRLPYYLENFTDLYYAKYNVSFGFDAEENKELERKSIEEEYRNVYWRWMYYFNNWDDLEGYYKEDGQILKPFMEFANLITPADTNRSICLKFINRRAKDGYLQLLQDYCNKVSADSIEEIDATDLFNKLHQTFQIIYDRVILRYIPSDHFYQLSKVVKPLLIYMNLVKATDDDLVVYQTFKEEIGNDQSLYTELMIEYRHYYIGNEVKKINKERAEKNRAIMKYLNNLFFAQRRITLEDYEGFSKSRNKLYELHEDFDYDPKNNKNCRPSVEDEAVNNYFIEEYHRVCAEKLTEEEYNVIKLYFDSLGYRDNLPRHIAEKLNIPKARVMSLKDSALKKLRNSNLKEYLD